MRLHYDRYVLGKGVQKIKTKTALVLSAVVLLLGSGSTAVISMLGTANAAPDTAYTNVDFGSLSLTPDRQTPSGGYSVSGGVLTMNIDNTAANTSGGGFYQTEGLQGTIPASQSVEAQLYVDPAWAGKQIRAGLWGIATSGTTAGSAWPIIEYTTVGDGGFTGWRVFDTMNGGWTNLPSVAATSGHWYTLEDAYNQNTDQYDYYVNDAHVFSLPANDGTNSYGKLTGVIFNSKNFATNNHADDYSVQWRNFAYGDTKPSTPTITAPTPGQYFATTPIVDSWTASSGTLSAINHYQVAYWYDDNHTFGGSTCPGLVLDSHTVSGCRDTTATSRNHTPALSEQGGVTIWVRAFDNQGHASDWSTPVHYYYDTIVLGAPMLLAPANNAVVNGASVLSDWSDVPNADHYVYESYNDAALTSLRYTQDYTASEKTATNVGNATFWWRVKAVDMYGHSGPWSDVWKVTVDNDAPVVQITRPHDGATVQNTVRVKGSVTDAHPDHYYAVVKDSHGTVVAGPGVVNDTNSFTNQLLFNWNTRLVPNGTYVVDLEARDAAGNKTAASVDTVTVTVKNVPRTKADCKNDGWKMYGDMFKNQGQCVSYVNHHDEHGQDDNNAQKHEEHRSFFDVRNFFHNVFGDWHFRF